MKSRVFITLSILAIMTIVIWPSCYFFSEWKNGNKDFVDGALGNLFATVWGLIAGIPVAL